MKSSQFPVTYFLEGVLVGSSRLTLLCAGLNPPSSPSLPTPPSACSAGLSCQRESSVNSPLAAFSCSFSTMSALIPAASCVALACCAATACSWLGVGGCCRCVAAPCTGFRVAKASLAAVCDGKCLKNHLNLGKKKTLQSFIKREGTA